MELDREFLHEWFELIDRRDLCIEKLNKSRNKILTVKREATREKYKSDILKAVRTLVKTSKIIDEIKDKKSEMDTMYLESLNFLIKRFKNHYNGIKYEKFLVAAVNNYGKIEGIKNVAYSRLHDYASFYIDDILDFVKLKNCKRFYVSHNHLDEGTRFASSDDIDCTSDILAECREAGLELIDHIIVTPDGCYSMMVNNWR